MSSSAARVARVAVFVLLASLAGLGVVRGDGIVSEAGVVSAAGRLAPAPAAGSFAPPEPGWQRVEIAATATYSDRYLPFGLDLSGPVPAIVFLHGSGATPEQWRPILAPLAEDLGVVLVVPKSVSPLGWGPGADDRTVAEALRLLAAEIPVDPARIGVAGHSSGGAYAYVLAYAKVLRFAGVFALSSPYRVVLAVADPDYTAPARLYYGTEDPNYQGGAYAAMAEQTARLGAELEEEIRPGHGHGDWPETTLPDGFRFLLDQRYRTAGGCAPSDVRLCLGGGRFALEASWETADGVRGTALVGGARTADSGLLYFFRPDNWELMVKVLRGCPVNGRWWVFTAGSTDVGYRLLVTDLETDTEKVFENPPGEVAESVTDTRAFRCP